MRYILCPFGSHGDVIPFINIGKALSALGNRVSVVTLSEYQSIVERAGLEFLSFCQSDIFSMGIQDPDLWHPVKGMRILLQQLAIPAVLPMFETVNRLIEEEPCELVIGSLAMGARIAAEKQNVPCTSLCLQPAVIRSIERMPEINGVPSFLISSHLIRKLIYRCVDLFVDYFSRKDINKIRRLAQIEPIKNVLAWWFKDHTVLALFPGWFASPASDWAPGIIQCDFPLPQVSPDKSRLPHRLLRFLNAGSEPILFTFGTGMYDWKRYVATIKKVCHAINQRYIIAGPGNDRLEGLPETGFHLDYADFSDLFPWCKLIVHHGGIGTTSEAFRAGIPQLIVPQAFDQPDNAFRIKRLGVGDYVFPKKFNLPCLTEKIHGLIHSSEIGHCCGQVAERMKTCQGIDKAVINLLKPQ